ncbi:hypothetical protein CLOM_g17879 [Closterium sp. NIES-68]|nr:hypothetical protein CLOM_g17879 [Closterium sp. NIES-68]GJP74009.1 hypothetical protein CLOP_g4662 [Closterium sp. NIES-67]
MFREPLLPRTRDQEPRTNRAPNQQSAAPLPGGEPAPATSAATGADPHGRPELRVKLTISGSAAATSGARASVDSANVAISEESCLCAGADPPSRRRSSGRERGEQEGAGRRGRWGSGGGGGEGLRSPRSPGLSKQQVLVGFDAGKAEGEVEAEVSAHLQTDFQTVLNTINLFVGAGLLSMGYAVMLGGWLSLLVLALCTTLFCTTARLLCRAFDALPPSTLPSYPSLALFAFGPPGEWVVMLAVLFEFWGALGMCLIIVWQSALIFLPSLPTLCLPLFHASSSATASAPLCLYPRHLVMVGSLALVIPTVLVRSFARLTNVALSGVASSTLLCSVMMGTWASDPSSALLPDSRAHHHSPVSWAHLPMAAGIFMVSLSGHAGLPSLRRSMQTPQHFERCINITFTCMFLLYATMGGFAYLYFGDSVRVLVTASLDEAGAAAGITLLRWGSLSLSLSALLSLLVAASVYSTIPALVYVMSELILDLSARLGLPVSSHKLTPAAAAAAGARPGDHNPTTSHSSAQPVPHRHSAIAEGITRLAVTFIGYTTAYLTYDILDRVESVVGGVCSVGVSMVLPAVIFDRIYSHQLSLIRLILLRGLITFGIVAACGIAYINIFR